MENEMFYLIMVDGKDIRVRGKNKFHALNRAKKQFPKSVVCLDQPAPRRRLVRIERSFTGNGRTYAVAIYSDGTTADLD